MGDGFNIDLSLSDLESLARIYNDKLSVYEDF